MSNIFIKRIKFIIFVYLPLLAVLGAIFYFSSQSTLPIDHLFDFQDKVMHFLAFFALGYTVYRVLRFRNINHLPACAFTILFCGLYGLSDEFHQTFVPNRVFDWYDLFADVFGAILAGFTGKYFFRVDMLGFLLLRIGNVQPKTNAKGHL